MDNLMWPWLSLQTMTNQLMITRYLTWGQDTDLKFREAKFCELSSPLSAIAVLLTDTVPLGWIALGGFPTVITVTVPSVWLDTDLISFFSPPPWDHRFSRDAFVVIVEEDESVVVLLMLCWSFNSFPLSFCSFLFLPLALSASSTTDDDEFRLEDRDTDVSAVAEWDDLSSWQLRQIKKIFKLQKKRA